MSSDPEKISAEGVLNPDPKRFFDSKNYNTLIVNLEGHSKKENITSELVLSLIEKEYTPDEKVEVLRELKSRNAQKVLVECISAIENPDKKAILIAACWESGLDFKDFLLFFTGQACSHNFNVVLESVSLIENNESVFDQESMKKAEKIISDKINENPATIELLKPLLEFISLKITV